MAEQVDGQQADTVICYIQHWCGGAAKFVEMAANKGKRIINLADPPVKSDGIEMKIAIES